MRADLTRAIREQDWHTALSICAKSQHLGNHRGAIKTGAAAIQNPNFYRQIKRDPETLIDQGIAAMKDYLKTI